jgi:prepilin-type N-terminal cleavage/methylation domain-containing protein
MKPRASRQQGFSLVELLVTALIFAIGLLGLAALQVSTMRSNSGGRNRVTATALAEGCLSSIQAEGNLSWSFVAGVMGASAAYTGARTYTGGTAASTAATALTFDVDGKPVANTDPRVVFTVNWTRLAPTAATPKATITGMNMSEFVVVVNWNDQTAASSLTLSRLIRY